MQRAIFLSFLLVSASFGEAAADATAETALTGRLLPAPRLKLESGNGWYVQTRGRLELDTVHIADDLANHRAGIYDRRTRLGFDAGYGDAWGATFEVDFADENPEYTDVFLHYRNQRNLHMRVGHFKEAFGMEQVQSSKNVLFNERAAIEILAPKRNLGMQATYYNANSSLTLGAFTDSMVTNSKKDKFAVTGRGTTVLPLANGKLHTGVSGSWRKMEQVGFSFSPPATDINILSTGRLYDVDMLTQGGVEAAYGIQNLLLSGEYVFTHLDREVMESSILDGGYVQAAWMLTGEPYTYNVAKNAIFQPVKPAKPFSVTQGTWGAWELAARYQTLSLSDGSVQAGHMQAVTGGINWYLNNQWRVSGDITYINSDAEAITPQDNPIISSLRVRVAF